MRDNIKKSHAKTGLKPATVWSKIPFSLSFKKEFGGGDISAMQTTTPLEHSPLAN